MCKVNVKCKTLNVKCKRMANRALLGQVQLPSSNTIEKR